MAVSKRRRCKCKSCSSFVSAACLCRSMPFVQTDALAVYSLHSGAMRHFETLLIL